jgi:hypothetical protein
VVKLIKLAQDRCNDYDTYEKVIAGVLGIILHYVIIFALLKAGGFFK